jgi:hypothetical protein
MGVVGRVVISLVAVTVIVFAILFALSHATGCPEGQVSVLGADAWYCVEGKRM